MNRMGCKESDFKYTCESILKNKNLLKLEGVYSHLSSSTNLDSSSNFNQFEKFEKAIYSISNYQNIHFHILNSAGLFNYKQYRFDIIRP